LLPEAVYEELTSNQDFLEEAEQVKSCEFFKKVFVGDSQAVGMLMRVTGLDLGESENGVAILHRSAHLSVALAPCTEASSSGWHGAWDCFAKVWIVNLRARILPT